MRKNQLVQIFKVALVSAFLFCLVFSSGLTGYYLGRKNRPLGVDSSSKEKTDFSLFWRAWDIIDRKYFGDIDDKNRLNGAIAGMVAGLKDPYTVYMEPAQSEMFKSDLQGSFGGIGAELIEREGLVTVVAALEDTPAEKAGLKPQDVILEVDGKKASDMGFMEVITMIRGDKGTAVELTVGRSGVEPFKVKITRDTITVKSVKAASVGKPDPQVAQQPTPIPTPGDTLGDGGSIAYIKINQFGDDTVELFRKTLLEARDKNKKGLIVDLRNNPGGYLNGAINAIGMVLPAKINSENANLAKRVAVLERSRDGKENGHIAESQPVLDTLPMVVVVNGGSASASEIFAGAMKDYKRATVVGTKTFGKGSVQDLVDLENGGSIKVTVAKWFTPLGSGIDHKGIDPDVLVELPDNTAMSVSDPQITKAIELLENR